MAPADKGGTTVIMEKTDYVNKASQIFNDREAYTPFDVDPPKKQAIALKKTVNELSRLQRISPEDSRFMTLSAPCVAHAYGLPKKHKSDAPLRMRVPLIGSITYNRAKWQKHLSYGLKYSVRNSRAFLPKTFRTST
ncbi:unnamed protein product [Schistocephalus solidus]|uniref:Uncharacterized protein n=1 Tax=Schistocephalus solidus TaxID=70667 RepID=A0A183TNG7_SCHSO|nr:unnamed protein product [Schistocephalus solidus]